MVNNNFIVIGKKNKKKSVSDADRGIRALGSTNNAGNSVKLVFGIIRLPWGLGFLCLNRRSMLDSKASQVEAHSRCNLV